MSAPVFDPSLFGLSDQDSLADLQAASKVFGRIVAHVEPVFTALGHQQGFIEGHDHGITEGILKAKDSLERLAHGG